MIHFVHPLWLLLPLLVLPAALLAYGGGRAMRGRARRLVPDRLRSRLLPDDANNAMVRRLTGRFLLLLFLGLAMARPQFGAEFVVEVAEARDIMLAIDTSRSMLATDTPPNRLDRARMASLDLLKSLPDDRFGVLGFAGSAFPLAPLTTDHDAIRETIANIDTDTLPVGGTSLASAVERSMEVFENLGPRRRALVILSDGEDLEGRLDGLAEKAKAKGILIFAFAVGTERGAMIPDPESPDGFVRGQDNQPVLSRQSLTALASLATASGGYAQVLSDSGSLPAQMADAMQLLESSAAEEKERSQAAEQFQWPLGVALAMYVVCLLMGAPRGHRLRTGAATAAVAGISLIALSPARAGAAEDPLAAVEQLENAGKYDEAIKAAATALRDPGAPRRAVAAANLGNVLYQAGRKDLGEDESKLTMEQIDKTLADWEDALGHLDHSLKLRPDSSPTRQNRDMVAKAIDELRSRRQQKKEEQKQQEKQKQEQEKQEPKDENDKNKEDGKDENDKQEQSGKDGGEKDDSKGDPKDEKDQKGEKDKEDGNPEDGDKQEQGEKPGDGKDPQEPKEGDKPGENDGKDPKEESAKDGEIQDASTGDKKPGRAGASSIPMQIGKDGRILLPEDPKEREKFLDTIRRNLEQRSMEDKKVKLVPVPKGTRRPQKNW